MLSKFDTYITIRLKVLCIILKVNIKYADKEPIFSIYS